MEHTALPWGVAIRTRTIQVVAGEKRFIIGPDTEAEATAAFIVRAVNSHYALVAALKRLTEYGNIFAHKNNEASPYAQARAALEKAGAE